MMPDTEHDDWDIVIKPKISLLHFNLKELWQYRDLLMMLVRRDFVSIYKQTILGPLWFFIQPILTTAMFVIVFGNIAKISTDGLPKILFYLAGVTIWNYFAEVLSQTSNSFVLNAAIFGKVYFPRLIMPLSKVISGLLKFVIQFLLFLIVFSFYYFKGTDIHAEWLNVFLLTPVLVILMAGLGLGAGLILSSLTTKYRDLTFLVTFGVQLMMYATPVIYPLSKLSEKYRTIAELNPMAPVTEAFRRIYLGTGILTTGGLVYSFLFMLVLLVFGAWIFNRVERSFMDIV